MNMLVFVYTICLILVCFAAAMFAVSAYAVSRRQFFIPQAVFFVCYIVEMVSILGAEFISQNTPFAPESYYEVTMPVLRIAMGACILHSLWLMFLRILDIHDKRVEHIPTTLFVILSITVLVALPVGPFRQWLFYMLRQIYIAFGLLFALYCWRKSDNPDYHRRLERYRSKYLLIWVLLACILLEDYLVIMVMPVPTKETGLPLYLSERNFAENIMMLFVAYHAIRTSLEVLSLRFLEPPVAQKGSDLERHIEEQLPAFAAAHGLSNREREVLALVIEGKDNRAIAQELFLSEGTIKTHVHNIMKKSEVKNREELKQVFWSE